MGNFNIDFKNALLDLRQFLATEIAFKMTKNACYFTFKALFVLKIFRFFSRLFGYVEKRIDQKDKVHKKKLMTSKPGKQIIVIQILPNISRSKGNQTIKLSELIAYNRNIFLEESYIKPDV